MLMPNTNKGVGWVRGFNRGEIGWILEGIGLIGEVQGGGGIFTKTDIDA